MLRLGAAAAAGRVLAKRTTRKVMLKYIRLYAVKNFAWCLVGWLCGLPIMLQGFVNPFDGGAHGAIAHIKSVYVTLPIVTLLPGLIELAWLPREHYPAFWNAVQKTFISDIWNIPPAGLIMYMYHGDDGNGSLTARVPGPSFDPATFGWGDVAQLLILLCSHEFWFYITHRMNHTETLYFATHGHHHKNQGYVFMVNNSDVDIWELCTQGLFGLTFPLLFMKPRMEVHLAALGFFFSYTCTIHSTHMRPLNLHVVHHQYGRLATNFGLYTDAMDRLVGSFQKNAQAYKPIKATDESGIKYGH